VECLFVRQGGRDGGAAAPGPGVAHAASALSGLSVLLAASAVSLAAFWRGVLLGSLLFITWRRLGEESCLLARTYPATSALYRSAGLLLRLFFWLPFSGVYALFFFVSPWYRWRLASRAHIYH